MKANVVMIEAGMTTAAMSVDRHDRMNRSTTMVASRLPETRWPWISWRAASIYRDWSWSSSS
jgi:hypothetical protein